MNTNELIHRYLLGVASEDEVQELESRLQGDEELQDEFLLQAELDAHLRQEAQPASLNADDELIPFDSDSGNAYPDTAKRVRFLQVGSMGLAAALVIAFVLLVQFGGQSTAMAAVQRSLNVAVQQMTRHYLVEIEFQPARGGTRKIEHELYTHGRDRFAMRIPGLPGGSAWLGQDGPEAWVVPPFGPVLKGDQSIHQRWLQSMNNQAAQSGPRKIAALSDMRVTALLKGLSAGYELEIIGNDELEIAGQGRVPCQHLRGLRKAGTPSASPDTIELWTSRESGVALRLIARWDLAVGEIGRKSFLFNLQGEEPSLSLPEDWFTAEGHYEGNRPTNQMK